MTLPRSCRWKAWSSVTTEEGFLYATNVQLNGSPKNKYLKICAVDQLHERHKIPAVEACQSDPCEGKALSSAQEKVFALFQDSFCTLLPTERQKAPSLKSFELKGYALLTQSEPKSLSSWRGELWKAEADAAKRFH